MKTWLTWVVVGFKTSPANIKVRFEDHKQMVWCGDGVGRSLITTVIAQVTVFYRGAIKESHVVEMAPLIVFHLEVEKHYANYTLIGHVYSPGAIGIVVVL